MSLTARLSAFSLAALATVLTGFSLALYGLAFVHLHRQDDERLSTALDTLAAAVEVHPDGVEWESDVRRLHVGGDRTDVRWVVRTIDGKILERSPDLSDAELDDLTAQSETADWKPGLRRLRSDSADSTEQTVHTDPDGTIKYPFIDLMVAIPLGPTRGTLRWLAFALASVSSAIGLLAIPATRWFCRRALRPVREMGAQANAMHADARGRLNFAPTGDELAALGGAFNGLLDRLDAAHERQRRFTGDASHQLRTPLAGLLGQVEICLRHPRSAEEYRRVLDRVERQGQNLRQIVEMLLFLARAEADALAERLECVDLLDWLPSHLERWHDHPRTADLQVELPESQCRAMVQPALLGQLLDNLLENAFKYSLPSTPVVVGLTADEKTIRLSVADHGDGIDAEDLPRLFDPFFRSERARRNGRAGIGLGLSVADRIARVFGGTLAVTSPVGEGSRFELTLARSRSGTESWVELLENSTISP